MLERYNKRKKPNIIMKDTILKAIFSKVGPILVAGVAMLIGLISSKLDSFYAYLATFEFIVPTDVQSAISYGITGIVWLAINYAINKYAGEHAKAIQEQLQKIIPNQVVDKWIGEKTVNAVTIAVANAKK